MPAPSVSQPEWRLLPPGDAPITAAEQSKLRKKIQNRLYQRTSRLRRRSTNPSLHRGSSRPYQVHRYRLDEQLAEPELGLNGFGLDDDFRLANSRSPRELSEPDVPAQLSTATWFPLPADHLHRTIKYNVCRGLYQNKGILACHTLQLNAPFSVSTAFAGRAAFPSYSVLFPASSSECGSLSPTQAQMNICHSSWIDILPCPILRENLMRWEFEFSHSEFVKDLVGTAINLNLFPNYPTAPSIVSGNEVDERQLCESSSSAEETGLIIWGEPYLVDSWEVTPHFLRKWAWALVGCGQLIDSTNRWRTSRGETTLRLPLS